MFEKLQKFFTNARSNDLKNGKTILFADDSEVDRKFVTRTLERGGYKVLAFEDGQSCLDASEKQKFDLAILDCDMPEMNGLEVCRQLKQNPKTRGIPIVFLTSDDTPRNIFDCYEMDAENYLKKPINGQTLLSEIEYIINTKMSVESDS